MPPVIVVSVEPTRLLQLDLLTVPTAPPTITALQGVPSVRWVEVSSYCVSFFLLPLQYYDYLSRCPLPVFLRCDDDNDEDGDDEDDVFSFAICWRSTFFFNISFFFCFVFLFFCGRQQFFC